MTKSERAIFERAMRRAHERRERRVRGVTKTFHERIDKIEQDFQTDSLTAQREYWGKNK